MLARNVSAPFDNKTTSVVRKRTTGKVKPFRCLHTTLVVYRA
jgi:hypothetical protein